MAEFSLADILKNVPKMDTGNEGREQIEYIDLDRIDPDPKNFYELSGLEELAANIELLGLQQPLRVRYNPETPGHVTVVSGHRRRAALAMLVDEGRSDFRSVPCIREQQAGSEAMQELRLIYANSDTRRMTSAETARQVERVEALLYQLKEEGVEFPGRMRDHVAEACRVSKSKIARLKVIREKLSPGIAKKYESGEMKEAVAYAFAKQPEDVQQELYDRLCVGANGCKYVTENSVESYLVLRERLDHDCKYGDLCSNQQRMLDKVMESNSYVYCKYTVNPCCMTCPDLQKCGASCEHAADRKSALRSERRAEIAEEKEKVRREEENAVRDLRMLWKRFGEARVAAGKSYDEIREDLRSYYMSSLCLRYENGDVDEKTSTPFGYNLDLYGVRRIWALADYLGCSVGYLLCREDVPKMGTGKVSWSAGSPTESGLYVMETELDGVQDDADIYRYDAATGNIYYPDCRTKNEGMTCVRYIRLPED